MDSSERLSAPVAPLTKKQMRGARLELPAQHACLRPVIADISMGDTREFSMTWDDFQTQNDDFMKLVWKAQKDTEGDNAALVLGQAGTGKLSVCQAIHHASKRAQGPFVIVYPGASAPQVEQAIRDVQEGSLVVREPILHPLEHIDRISQQKGARLLVTSTRKITEVDCHAGLFDRLAKGIRAEPIQLPTLRERIEDVGPLFDGAAHAEAVVLHRTYKGRAQDLTDFLVAHPWPGNVSELVTLACRAMLLARSSVITRADLEATVVPAQEGSDEIAPLDQQRAAAIHRALELCEGNIAKAARKLNVAENTLHKFLKDKKPKGTDRNS